MKRPRESDGDLKTTHSQGETRTINLGGKSTVKMGAGDRIVIMTPGGGAWGKEGDRENGNGNGGRKADKDHRGSARGSLRDRLAAQEGV